MTARCAMMPGGPVADAVFADLEPRIEKLVDGGHTPGLGTILVGDDGAERRLRRHEDGEGARSSAATSPHVHLPDDATQADVRRRRSARSTTTPRSTRMLVQHPTPPQIDFDAALLAIDPDKDVDGLHPVNLGRLALGMPGPGAVHAGRHRGAARATTRSRSPGATCASSGRGITLGRPLALLLSQKRPTANAAVTVVHTGVPDWPEYTRRADIVVAAAGVPGHPPARAHHARARSWSAAACATRAASCCPTSTRRCEEVAGWITPRVGGVGPDHRSPCCSATPSRPPSAEPTARRRAGLASS